MLLFFTARWCVPCDEMKHRVFFVGAFAGLVENGYVPIEIVDQRRGRGSNPPEVQRLMVQFVVRGFPTLVVVRPEGEQAVRQFGFASREETVNFLRAAARRLETLEEKARREKAH